jgi:hypothetical protein
MHRAEEKVQALRLELQVSNVGVREDKSAAKKGYW